LGSLVQNAPSKILSNYGESIIRVPQQLEESVVVIHIGLQRSLHIQDVAVGRGAHRALFLIVAQAALMEGMHAQEVNSR